MPTLELVRRAPVSGNPAATATTLFAASGVTITETAWRPKSIVRSLGHARLAAEIAIGSLVLSADPNRIASTDPLCLWLGPREWLVIGRDVSALGALPAGFVGADLSDGLAEFGLSGPLSRTLLGCASSLDFHPSLFAPGHSARTRFARTAAVIACRGPDDFALVFERSVAVYAAEWLKQAVPMIASLAAAPARDTGIAIESGNGGSAAL